MGQENTSDTNNIYTNPDEAAKFGSGPLLPVDDNIDGTKVIQNKPKAPPRITEETFKFNRD
ncbi:MAG: hypothetical protein LBN03_00370 [Bifidobacteriaceae bacterium]|jgi:hypothetical protein|nr:hypothetical protein [Bifidobacteriaceae bacterium]